jgi:hypothetical protein
MALIRMVPAGFSRNSPKASSSTSISSSLGPTVCNKRSPASVGETLRVAGQEPNAHPFFESADSVAERRLGNAQLRRGFREAALSRYGQEGQEVVELSTLHLSSLLISPCALYRLIARHRAP